MKRVLLVSLPVCLFLCLGANDNVEDKLWHYRNLGKAMYENPTSQVQAIDEFKKALDLAPDSIREQLNYGLALLRGGKTDEAIAQLIKVQKEDPKLPHTWFNLGIYYRKSGDFDKAMEQFKQMVELVPDEPKSHYNLGVLYRQNNKLEDALKEFQITAKLDPNLAAPHFQMFNIYRQSQRKEDGARELQLFTALKKSQEGAAIPEDMEWCDYAEIWDPIDMKPVTPPPAPHYDTRKLPLKIDPATAGMLALDLDGIGHTDLLVWSSKGIFIYRNGDEAVKVTGLEGITGVVSVASGDYNNDGLPDLCVLTDKGVQLWQNVKGKFVAAPKKLSEARFEKALWIDYDHDYDLDLMLLGEHSMLFRNEGESGFADHTKDYPFDAGHAIDGAVTRVMSDSKSFDVVVSYSDHPGIVYLDHLGEHFEASPLPALPAGARQLVVGDFNRDAWLDLMSDKGPLANLHGKFQIVPAVELSPGLEGDFDNDGRLDRATMTPTGVEVALNRSDEQKTRDITVQIVGVKNPKLGYGSEVEIKAGLLYQKKLYDGVPLTFDLGGRKEADTVRITWANGMIQNETEQAAGKAYKYPEAQRLSGSCPMIWSRDANGKFRFITDVLGVAPLGASSGDGKYFPVDHQEFIQIPPDALHAVDGQYEIRISEELSEVSYIDQVRLLAVDHPADQELFLNEKWKSPPYPEFRLYGARKRIYPVSARDDNGGDVLKSVLARDGSYPSTFRHDMSGVAEMHSLTLDFGPDAARDNRAVLLLNGWVDWADGSTFMSAAQEHKGGLVTPYLQVKDAQGRWKTVIDDMGMPSGKPKTIGVDLTGKFLSKSREVRIVTNICVYWDEIFLSDNSAPPPASVQSVPMSLADLHFRGFSQPVITADRSQPEAFLYNVTSEFTNWNPTPGMYTRYGDVRPLLARPDDMFVIMGSGDEMRLLFDERRLPALRPGWKRDFVLKVDGWAKDRDANTAFSQTVEPLPFHSMTSYPYAAGEHFPHDAAHEAYRKAYNTRPALRLIRPLNEQIERAQVQAHGSGN